MTIRKKILNYLIVTLNGMALGLFSTLIIGLILRQIGTYLNIAPLVDVAGVLASLMGVGIGLGVAFSLKLTGLPLIAGAMAGGIATGIMEANDPVVAYLATIAAIEAVRQILRKRTPFDIILIPLVSSLVALVVVLLIGAYVAKGSDLLGQFIQDATAYGPFMMGIIIAVVMGMALTSPISSAAIAIAFSIGGIAGGAAVIGGVVQMLGFAVMSRKDNSIGAVISIAIGTSMLQFKNILRKPIIWLPPIIVSAFLGPLSTLLFKIQTDASGAGMGTSGLVGQIATFDVMGYAPGVLFSVLILHFVLPITLVFGIDILFRKQGWIVAGDLSLQTYEESNADKPTEKAE